MKLFDEIVRDYSGPKDYAESDFHYLNRSVRSESENIRVLLEKWFQHVPSQSRPELRSRFRDKDSRQHASAFFELYMHELLNRLNFRIQLHPGIPGSPAHPDFLVFRNKRHLLYLEATAATSSDSETGARARENQVYDSLNRMESPNFFIGLTVHGAPNSPPPGRRIREFLEQKLARSDPDKVTEEWKKHGKQALPSWKWNYEGWKIEFFAVPKVPDARGKPGVRPIGIHCRAEFTAAHNAIRNSIKDKARKYGNLDLPYVIAANYVNDFGADDIDITNALFGEEQFAVRRHGVNVMHVTPGRKRNGVWWGPHGPQNRGVSAVLITVNLTPWTMARVTPVVWHNPWANSALLQDIWPLCQRVVDLRENQLLKRSGESIPKLLGIDTFWPRNPESV